MKWIAVGAAGAIVAAVLVAGFSAKSEAHWPHTDYGKHLIAAGATFPRGSEARAIELGTGVCTQIRMTEERGDANDGVWTMPEMVQTISKIAIVFAGYDLGDQDWDVFRYAAILHFCPEYSPYL